MEILINDNIITVYTFVNSVFLKDYIYSTQKNSSPSGLTDHDFMTAAILVDNRFIQKSMGMTSEY